MGTYQKCSFCGGINVRINHIMCKDKVVIPSIIQSYVLNWYHTYLLHPLMDITEAMIRQHVYWPFIIDSVQKELINCDTFQRIKGSNKNMVN